MPSNSKKKRKAAPEPSKPSTSDDDDEEEEEAEPLNLGTSGGEELNVDFGFFDPKPSDFHGMRTLLAGSGALVPEGSPWDVGGLADALAEQAAVGSLAKVVGEGEGAAGEPADDEVLGFVSAINLHAHRAARFAQELRASYLKRCADADARARLGQLLDGGRAALVVSERMLNLPAALVPSLFDSLLQVRACMGMGVGMTMGMGMAWACICVHAHARTRARTCPRAAHEALPP